MVWIKRNLFFVVGGLIALLLLGAAAFYDYQSWDHNATTFGRLNEIYAKLKELGDKKPSPGNNKIDNIKMAKEQEQEVRNWIDGTGNTFKPIEPIPNALIPIGAIPASAPAALAQVASLVVVSWKNQLDRAAHEVIQTIFHDISFSEFYYNKLSFR